VPIQESDNSDVIALRSAIALLQLQKETGKRDIQTLLKLKQEAAADPEGFVSELVKRKAEDSHDGPPVDDLLSPTLRYLVDAVKAESAPDRQQDTGTTDAAKRKGPADQGTSDDDDEVPEDNSKFAATPKPQNIFRMPPINWAKYQVVGPSLDKLHEEQRDRPVQAQPFREDVRAESYVMAAPYQSMTGETSTAIHPMQTRKGSKKTA
jgi:hypothetical protein